MKSPSDGFVGPMTKAHYLREVNPEGAVQRVRPVSSTILTLIVIPVLYFIWRRVQLRSAIPSPVS